MNRRARDGLGWRDRGVGQIRLRGDRAERLLSRGRFDVTCWREQNGIWRPVWREEFPNKTPDASLVYQLNAAFTGGTAYSSFYIGLTNASPVGAAADTMASHGGWTENTAYSEGARQAWTKVLSTLTLSNSASKATFTINAGSQTIGGAFVTTDSTKGGSTGTLIAVGAFTQGNRTPASGDQIVCQYDYTAASTN